jgi:Tfp pilus assembly protein PilV
MMSIWAGGALLVCGGGLVPLVLSAAQALQWERDSLARGQAVLLAQDLSHRLHLNASTPDPYQLAWGQTPPSLSCRDRPCSRTEWAQSDLAIWRAQLTTLLPDGDAWLQGSGSGDTHRWLVLAWASGGGSESVAPSRLPVSCPAGKRCLAVVLCP